MSKATDDKKRKELVELTKENQDNHSAWIIHIKDIVKEGNDDSQNNEELSSRCNMILSIHSSGINGEGDVVIVSNRKQTLFNRIIQTFKK